MLGKRSKLKAARAAIKAKAARAVHKVKAFFKRTAEAPTYYSESFDSNSDVSLLDLNQ